MPGRTIAALLVLLACACSSPAEVADRTGVAAKAINPAAGQPVAQGAAALEMEEENALFSFDYNYPVAIVDPALAQLLRADAVAARSRLIAEATEARASSQQDRFPYQPHSYLMRWDVVADTPGWLSLSGEFSTYSGGAHGMYGLRSLVWDKSTKRALEGVALFQSAQALESALGSKLCAALNAEREKRRGEPVLPEVEGDMGFAACQKVADATVLVGSSTGKAFDRIGIWFGPYVVGPYAEGAYELGFPVDAAVLRAVKPDYAKAFATKR